MRICAKPYITSERINRFAKGQTKHKFHHLTFHSEEVWIPKTLNYCYFIPKYSSFLSRKNDFLLGKATALRPLPSAQAESANFRPFYVKRADFSPPPPATKKRRKLVKIRPRCPHLATKKRRKVVKIRPCGGWWVGGWFPPLFFFNLITVKWSWYKIGDVIDVIKVNNMTDVMNVINQCK